MNIRLFHARVLTMERGFEPFMGEIWIRDSKIVYVMDYSRFDRIGVDNLPMHDLLNLIHWDLEYDCNGNLLMPGFKNAHTHSPMTMLRSYADDLPLDEWLNKKIFPMEKQWNDEAMDAFTRLAILEYLSGGITSVFDMYLKPNVVGNAMRDMGMRCVLVSGLNDFTSSIAEIIDEYLKWNQGDPLVGYRLGIHAEYTCSQKLIRELSKLVEEFKTPVYMHLSETEKEVEECKERYGMTPTQFLDSNGLFEYGGGGFHCIYMSPEDMDIFEKKHLCVVTNPSSNLKLASGIAPIAEYVRRGITVAIGTDGAASNNSLDMFKEMFLVSGLSKLREKDAASLDASEVLYMATVGGARVMGLDDGDVIAPGKLADLILIDLKQPNMQPLHNIAKNIVYSGSKSNVLMTMVGGKILYDKGEFHLGQTADEIYARCERELQNIMT